MVEDSRQKAQLHEAHIAAAQVWNLTIQLLWRQRYVAKVEDVIQSAKLATKTTNRIVHTVFTQRWRAAEKGRNNTYHLEESKVSVEDVVEVDLRVVPGVIEFAQRLALVAPRHDAVVDRASLAVNAVLEAAAEQVDAHDAKDKPEDETDEKHVEDGRDGLD